MIDNLTKMRGHQFPMEFACFIYLLQEDRVHDKASNNKNV